MPLRITSDPADLVKNTVNMATLVCTRASTPAANARAQKSLITAAALAVPATSERGRGKCIFGWR